MPQTLRCIDFRTMPGPAKQPPLTRIPIRRLLIAGVLLTFFGVVAVAALDVRDSVMLTVVLLAGYAVVEAAIIWQRRR
jgi:hypothetical protein